MRIMGLDVGTKTIGVAVSDPLGWTAQSNVLLWKRIWLALKHILKNMALRHL